MSLCSHMMCFESSERLMEKKKSYKSVRYIDSVIFAGSLSFMHLFSCLCLQYFNTLSTQSSLLTLCRTWQGKIKGLKKMPIFVWCESYFFFSYQFLGCLGQCVPHKRMKKRSVGEQSYCSLNLIKGRGAFKCLLFPWAKRLWASLLSPVHPAQTPPPLDTINIERIPWPALHSYNNSVRTKVNALNLISILVIFNGVVMASKGR